MDSVQEEVTITIQDNPIDWDEFYDDDEYVELDLESMSKKELIETAEDWEVDIDKKASVDKIRQTIAEALF